MGAKPPGSSFRASWGHPRLVDQALLAHAQLQGAESGWPSSSLSFTHKRHWPPGFWHAGRRSRETVQIDKALASGLPRDGGAGESFDPSSPARESPPLRPSDKSLGGSLFFHFTADPGRR